PHERRLADLAGLRATAGDDDDGAPVEGAALLAAGAFVQLDLVAGALAGARDVLTFQGHTSCLHPARTSRDDGPWIAASRLRTGYRSATRPWTAASRGAVRSASSSAMSAGARRVASTALWAT